MLGVKDSGSWVLGLRALDLAGFGGSGFKVGPLSRRP